MKGIYISGAVTGNDCYEENFNREEEYLRKEFPGIPIFNPARIMRGYPYMGYEDCMQVCIHTIDLFCDTVYMLPDWKGSKGANRELGFALGRDIAVIYADKWHLLEEASEE